MLSKELKQIVKPYLDLGCRLTEANHFKVIFPHGRMVTISGTASDWRALANIKGDLRRMHRNYLEYLENEPKRAADEIPTESSGAVRKENRKSKRSRLH